MSRPTRKAARPRVPLSRERVLRTAIERADRDGIAAISTRKLGKELGVEGMALYHHFESKEEVLDGMIDLVFDEIDLTPSPADWKMTLRQRSISARDALARHPWAIGLMESRPHPGPANLKHHDAMLGSLREAGFSIPMAAAAYRLLDSYIHGFALQHTSVPLGHSKKAAEVAQAMLEPPSVDEYPNLGAMIEHALENGDERGDEFEWGLDLILEALDKIRGTL
jgi:AcrR family transcriptional regulator